MSSKPKTKAVAKPARKSAFNRASSMVRKRAGDLAQLAAAQVESELEKRVWPEVRKRLMGEQAVVPAGERREYYNDFDLQTRFNDLVETSLTEDRKPARIRLFKLMLAQMLPDEARIMAAMSDNEERVLMHIAAAGRLTVGSGQRIASNFSDVGRAAGILNLDLAPTYLQHLMSLGLLVAGPENSKLQQDYDKLETDNAVQTVIHGIERNHSAKAKILRHTIRLSTVGSEFCSAVIGDSSHPAPVPAARLGVDN